MSISDFSRGGLYLVLGSVIASIIGYVYWFLISILGGAEIVGITSSVLSLSLLVTGIASLELPTGVQRFLGRDFSRRRIRSLNVYFWSSLILVSILCALSAVCIFVIAFLNVNVLGFSTSMLVVTGLLVFLGFSSSISALFSSILRTQRTAASNVISALIRLGSGVFLVYFGLGWFGAVLGSIFASLSLSALMLFYALKELRRLGGVEIRFSSKALRESLRASFASWVPTILYLLGMQLGTLVVFGVRGGFEAGTFYIAYIIFSIVNMAPATFAIFLFPVLSGSTDEARSKEVGWRGLKFCLALACPLASFLVFYSVFPLSLTGGEYVQAAPTLSLLALSIIPLTYASTVASLVYALGFYRKVLVIGLAMNVPRVALYFLLAPAYGGFGVALAFFIGAVASVGAAAYASKRAGFKVSSKKTTVVIASPLIAGFLCFQIGLNWLIGGAVILLASVLCYGRLGVVERSELRELARGFASEKAIARAGERLNWVLKIIYGE